MKLVRGCLWTLGELEEGGIERRTGMVPSASTGGAGSITDGDMAPVKEKFFGYDCLSSQVE